VGTGIGSEMELSGRMVITGGCGFIGTNFVRFVADNFPALELLVFDKLTYAGNLENIADLIEAGRVKFIRGDISNPKDTERLFEGVRYVVNFAAETHVDRSLVDPVPFVRTNICGVANMLELLRKHPCVRFLHISSDEVYGPRDEKTPADESSPLAPTNPYAVTKASGDMLCISYARSFDLDILIARPTNNYGPYQFPEKIIPLFITNAIQNKPLPLYGDGLYIRDWLFVTDTVKAILMLLKKGGSGEIYNIAGRTPIKNIDIAQRVLELTNRKNELITYTTNRKIHDRAYFIDDSRIRSLGWAPEVSFEEGIRVTVDFYKSKLAGIKSTK